MNPSIEVTTNRLGKVTNLKALNKDGQEVLDSIQIDDKDLDSVVEDLVDAGIATGYLTSETNNFIVVSDNEKTPDELNEIKEIIDRYVEEKTLKAETATMVTPKDYNEEDLERLNVSPAKMRIVEEIRDVNPSYSADELVDLSMAQLMIVMEIEGIDPDSVLYGYDDDLEEEVERYLREEYGDELEALKANADNQDDQADDQNENDDNVDDTETATEERATPTETSPKGLPIGVKDAVNKVLAAYPDARITEVELENDDGKWEYEIDAETDGIEIDATVDANSGELIDITTEDDDGERDEAIDVESVLEVDDVVNIANAAGITRIDDLILKNEGGDDYWEVDNIEGGADILVQAVNGTVTVIENDDTDDQDDLDDTDDQDDRDDQDDADDIDDTTTTPAPAVTPAPAPAPAPAPNYDDDYYEDDYYDDDYYDDDWDDDYDDDWDDDYDDDWDDDDDDDWDDDDDDD